MSRDPSRLYVFRVADDLAVDVYRLTRNFPSDERFGLRLQMRRAAVSVPANIVEGSARQSRAEYLHFLSIALGSASETRYFVQLAARLDLLEPTAAATLRARYDHVIRGLAACLRSLRPAAQPKRLRP
jgi:four helix bundle protein